MHQTEKNTDVFVKNQQAGGPRDETSEVSAIEKEGMYSTGERTSTCVTTVKNAG